MAVEQINDNETLSASNYVVDIENNHIHPENTSVKSFIWKDISVTVKDRKSQRPLKILDSIDGIVEAGQICALMGPSGSGKTTLLNILARRNASSGSSVEGSIFVNKETPTSSDFRALCSYVEQEDALIGSLTVRETMDFAARLAHQKLGTKSTRHGRIDSLLTSFGLQKQANSLIGTPIRKGISGGQKRRLSIASQLITESKILFLDEPTSGLDSAASWEVMSFIKEVAQQNKLIVIASIHQPSTSTFELFDKLLLLSEGRSQYFGPVTGISPHFDSLGFPIPLHTNPAEFMLEMVNADFSSQRRGCKDITQVLQRNSASEPWRLETVEQIHKILQDPQETPFDVPSKSTTNFASLVLTLVHRSFIKSYRDVVAYQIRILMYTGLAIMMGTVWLRLETRQIDIQPFINAIFFGCAFMSFMAVAYVPSFLEDRSTYVKERANGLYGPTAFIVSNFIIGLPYLFFISIFFSSIAYFLSNFRPTPTAFFLWVMWLFLDLLAAESLVVLVSSLFPNFVVSLALTAFANGLWMSVGGFLVPPTILNVFYKYVFHYIDYQTYVFQGMMVNEFAGRTYNCDSDCHCMYVTELASECKISGKGVLDMYNYHTGNTGKWVGILMGIILGYRLLGWAVLSIRK